MIMLALFLFSPISLHAEEIDMSGITGLNGDKTEVKEPTVTNSTDNKEVPIYKEWEEQLPNVSVEDMSARIGNKLWELVNLLRQNATPVFVLFFIASAIITITGALSKKGTWTYGVTGMCIIVLVYTAVNYAEYIMQFVSQWIVS